MCKVCSQDCIDCQTGELWKPLVERPIYQISCLGRIKNPQGRLLKSQRSTTGYNIYVINGYGPQLNLRTHRSVALAFLPNDRNLPVVAHLDSNQDHYQLWNLEWSTTQDNAKEQHQRTQMGTKSSNSKLDEADIIWIRTNWIKGDKIFGTCPLARKYNVASAQIHRIVHFLSYQDVRIK